MAGESSFDVVSEFDDMELRNALDQVRREVQQRYDFKGAKAEIDLNAAEKTLTLVADDEMKMNALWEIVQTRLVRRGVAIKNFKAPESDAAAGGAVKVEMSIPAENDRPPPATTSTRMVSSAASSAPSRAR